MIDWLLFIFLNLLCVISPGPDFALVTRYGLTGSKKLALQATFGISAALLIHVFFCTAGIVLFLQSAPALLNGIQIIGALYLAYLGARMFFDKSETTLQTSKQNPFLAGFITNLLNPKAMLLLFTLFSQFASAMTTFGTKLLFALTIPLIALSWFSLLSYCFTAPFFLPFFQKHRKKFMMVMAIAIFSFSIFRMIPIIF